MSLISESQNNTLWETLSSYLVERCLHQEWGKGTAINFSFLQKEREGVKIGILGWFLSHNKGDNGGRGKISETNLQVRIFIARILMYCSIKLNGVVTDLTQPPFWNYPASHVNFRLIQKWILAEENEGIQARIDAEMARTKAQLEEQGQCLRKKLEDGKLANEELQRR